jgi:putative flippase GtrA
MNPESSARPEQASLPTVVRFLLAGGVAALANFFSRLMFSRFMPFAAAIVLAYFVGMATAFICNRRFVFRNATNRMREQILWFVAVNLLAALQTLGTSLLLAEIILPAIHWQWHPESVAHAVGIVVPVFISYIAHRRLTFR